MLFKEQSTADDDQQLAAESLEDSLKAKNPIPSAFPGKDFFLTEIQLYVMFSQNFLADFLTTTPYREHASKNYTEKIFYFEPLNKFYDLIRIRRMAWERHLEFEKMHDNFRVHSK